jgi:CDP-diacylglycerol--glycerol-3-phosphate 3-phosphatidyltransferase
MNLANKITVFRLILVPVFMSFATLPIGVLGIEKHYMSLMATYIATAIFLLAAVTDKLDGYIARKYKQITRLGIFLDPLADKLLITAALLCLVQMKKVDIWIALIIIGRELIITFFRLSAVYKGVVLPADRSGKIKMVFQVAAITFVLLNNFPFSLICNIRIDNILMYIAAAITIFSGANYIIRNFSIFNESKKSSSLDSAERPGDG